MHTQHTWPRDCCGETSLSIAAHAPGVVKCAWDGGASLLGESQEPISWVIAVLSTQYPVPNIMRRSHNEPLTRSKSSNGRRSGGTMPAGLASHTALVSHWEDTRGVPPADGGPGMPLLWLDSLQAGLMGALILSPRSHDRPWTCILNSAGWVQRVPFVCTVSALQAGWQALSLALCQPRAAL